MASLLKLAKLGGPAPDHGPLCCRQRGLAVTLPHRPNSGTVGLLSDSTGIEVPGQGEGEWSARKPGASRRRQWSKVHLDRDAETLKVRAIELTGSRVGDASERPELLTRAPAEETACTVTVEGACDAGTSQAFVPARRTCYVNSVRRNGRPWTETTPGAQARNKALRATSGLGRWCPGSSSGPGLAAGPERPGPKRPSCAGHRRQDRWLPRVRRNRDFRYNSDRDTPGLMRPLRYSVSITLDGCRDHRAITPDEELHRHAAESIVAADALLLGRVTYGMVEDAWRPVARTGVRPDWMPGWMEPFARPIDAARKHVVSNTLNQVDWNAELLGGDRPDTRVRQLKQQPGRGLFVVGVTLLLPLAVHGMIDEWEFIVFPRLAGRGPTLFAGLARIVDLRLVSRQEFASGAVAMRYEPGTWRRPRAR